MFNGIQLRPTPNNRELGLKSLFFCSILNFYRTQVSLGSSLWVPVSVCTYVRELCENFADVTLADDDTNLILADDANRAIWR